MRLAAILYAYALILIVRSPVLATSPELVFPGAEGFGVTTPAGLGGRVFRVTTLADGGPGSLRQAVGAKGPRVIIFEVSGTIELSARLRVRHPFISILGQTAPSPGITLSGSSLTIQTHDVLVQHIRIRVGDATKDPDPSTLDGLQILAAPGRKTHEQSEETTYNVVIDHCSISWAIDENVSIYDARDVTIRNCIISEALGESLDRKGEHSMGMLIGRTRRLALIGNLIAHCASRSPKIGGATESLVCNNVVFNPRWNGIEVENVDGVQQPKSTIIANVVIPGEDSRPGVSYPVWVNRVGPGAAVYVADMPCDRGEDLWACVKTDSTGGLARTDEPPVTCDTFTPLPYAQTLQRILDNAGARPRDRDAVDTRIVSGVRERRGRIIDSPRDVGGLPALEHNVRELEPPVEYRKFNDWLRPYTEIVEGVQSQ